MKKILFLLSFLASLTAVGAAQYYPLHFLYGQAEVNVVFDYSQIKFERSHSDAFALESEFEGLQSHYQAAWERVFLHELNDEAEDLHIRFATQVQSEYTLCFRLLYCTNKGSLIRAEAIFQDATGKEVLRIPVACRRGHYGHPAELLQESMERLAENLGEIIGG